MQNRRDQVQAHSFMVGRLVSALLRAEPDSPMPPLRRFILGVIWGSLLGAVVIVGFGIYGVFSPGGDTSWRTAGALIVEKETGNRYIFVDGRLHPVLNYTSARLILGKEPTIVRVSRGSLRDVPHGLAIGIPGAPDYLPGPSQMDGRQWQVCSTSRPDTAGAPRPYVTVQIGQTALGLRHAPDEALLARTPAGQLYLVWNDQRLLLSTAGALVALGYSAVLPYDVGWAWLNALPAGPDLAAPDVADRGTAGPSIEGRPSRVGQLFFVDGDGAATAQHFVVRRDGLSPLTPLGAALLLTDPRTRAAYQDEPVASFELGPAALARAPRSAQTSIDPGLPPQAPPAMALEPGEVPCLQLGLTDDGPTVRAGAGATPPVVGAAPQGTDPARADLVVVGAGAGLLVRDQPAPQAVDGALYLIVDTGVRYPLPDEQTADVLGYGDVTPLPLPAPVLALLPVGNPLNREAAHATVALPATATGASTDAGGGGATT